MPLAPCHTPKQLRVCALQIYSCVHVLLQDAAMREHRERLASAKQKARQLVRHQDVVLTERVDQVDCLSLSCLSRLTKSGVAPGCGPR